MGIPKRKLSVTLYPEKILVERRQELLEKITKSDAYLPESILHDDMDMGFLEYVNKNFKVVSNNVEIPIINKILTIQRWGEFRFSFRIRRCELVGFYGMDKSTFQTLVWNDWKISVGWQL